MFKRRTLFVIGAGASCEAGLPVGVELASRIRLALAFQAENLTLVSGHAKFHHLLHHRGSASNRAFHGELLQKALFISRGVTTAGSIDRFIDRFHHDKDIAEIGKAIIITLLLEAENKSLFRTPNAQEAPWATIDQTWYPAFARRAFGDHLRRSDIHDAFKNLSVISFNYDRCLQQYLTLELIRSYGLEIDEALQIVRTLRILWPYGNLGSFGFPNEAAHPGMVAFGDSSRARNAFDLAANIRTFTEQITDKDALKQIQEEVRAAESIIFLGFGFHDQNLELLADVSEPPGKVQQILATVYGESAPNVGVIRKSIQQGIARGQGPNVPIIPENMKCVDLFKDYWRLMT